MMKYNWQQKEMRDQIGLKWEGVTTVASVVPEGGLHQRDTCMYNH